MRVDTGLSCSALDPPAAKYTEEVLRDNWLNGRRGWRVVRWVRGCEGECGSKWKTNGWGGEGKGGDKQAGG